MRKRNWITLAIVAVMLFAGCQNQTPNTEKLPSPTAEPTKEAELTVAPQETLTPEPTATNTPTPEPTATNTPTPEPTATNIPTPEPTATTAPTPEPTATDTPTPEPTATSTPKPTATSTPTPVPTKAPEGAAAILDAAYALGEGEALTGSYTLTGVITKIDTAYSSQYKNITVTIVVDGDTARPVQCYRLKGNGVDKLAVGDTVTVTGTLKNYYGKVEFDAGCTADAIVKGEGATTQEPTVSSEAGEILKKAYALADGEALSGTYTLEGTVISVDTAYSSQYNNVTVTIEVEGYPEYPMMCYRLKGTGADQVGVGDTITVTGTIKSYYGKIEFDAGCSLDKLVKGTAPTPEMPTTPEGILEAAYALEKGKSLPAECELTGVISSIDTAYSDQYKNITVTIVVGGDTSKPIQCFRLKGDGADKLAVGDTITVKGTIINYNGKIEFNSGCTFTK